MDKNPLVSIIITTFDRPELLRKAVEKCLEQTYERKEILVVDHSGEKYAEDIVEDYEDVEYFATSEELGQIGAWNISLDKVSGDYIQFHDDDDWLKPSKIERQVELLNREEDVDVAYCGIVSERDEVLLPEKEDLANTTEKILRQEFKRCQTTTMLVESSLLEDIMPLHEFGNVGDLALQIELCQLTEFDFIDRPLVRRMLYHDSSGNSLLNRRKRLELIDYYSEIYDEYPEIKRETLIDVNRMLGLKLLDEKMWSSEAIRSFYTVVKLKEEPDIRDFTRFSSSFLGKKGLRFGDWMYHNYLSKL
jgi:glycosyltransferase involved in cell wall biosynthesis